MISRFNIRYADFLSVLLNVTDIILTFVRTLIVSLSVPVSMVFIAYVEQTRLYHGIRIFEEENEQLAHLAAWVLVMLNISLEFMIVYEEDKHGYRREDGYRWSLKRQLLNILSLVGILPPEKKSPAHRYRSMLGLVTATVLVLALLGSMWAQIRETGESSWHESILSLLLESSLTNFLTWLSGLLFTVCLVLAAQSLANHVALHTTSLIREINKLAHNHKLLRQINGGGTANGRPLSGVLMKGRNSHEE